MPVVAGYDPNPSLHVGVEVAFTNSPDDPAPVWTDLTSRLDLVAGVSYTRGRGDEFSVIQPSSLSMTLDNLDGHLTAGNAASPYYPNVKPQRKIRVFYTSPSTAVRLYLFTGYVEEWPVEWPGGGDYAQAQITATDRLARLGAARNLRSVIEETILPQAPAIYYPLGEAEGSTSSGDTIGDYGNPLTVTQYGSGGTLAFGTATGPPTDGLPAPTFTRVNDSNGKALTATLHADFNAGGVLSVRCSFLTSTLARQTLVQMGTGYVAGEVELYVDSTGHLAATGGGFTYDPLGTIDGLAMASTATVTDGLTHDAVLVLNNGSASLYLDGALVASDTYSKRIGLDAFTTVYVGGGPNRISSGSPFLLNGVICHVGVFATALTAAQALDQYTATSTGFSGESSDERIARLASWAGIAPSEVALDAGASTSIAFVDTTDTAALQAMQDVAYATEGGRLFVDGSGTLVFHSRTRVYDTRAATASVDADLLGPDSQFVLSTQGVVNDLIGTRPNGGVTRATNEASVEEYGLLSQSVTILTTSDAEVRDAIGWRSQTAGVPQIRIPRAAFDLYTDSTGYQEQLRSLDIGSRVTVTALPPQAPSSSVDLVVEGYTDNISLSGWTRVANTSNYGAALALEWDEGYWDSDARWAY